MINTSRDQQFLKIRTEDKDHRADGGKSFRQSDEFQFAAFIEHIIFQ